MPLLHIIFVVLLLLLTGALVPLIAFSVWTVVVMLGMWLVGWLIWRGMRTEIGLVLLVFVGMWVLRQLPPDQLKALDLALMIVLGFGVLVALVMFADWSLPKLREYLRKPPVASKPPRPQARDPDYLDP